MKDLKTILEVSILAGIEDTLKEGDKIEEQFNKIKNLMLDSLKYSKLSSNSYFLAINNVDAIFSLMGIKIQKKKYWSLMIGIKKDNEYDGWGDYVDKWKFDFDFADLHIKKTWPAKNLSFPKLLATKIEPLIRDFEAFKKFIDENK